MGRKALICGVFSILLINRNGIETLHDVGITGNKNSFIPSSEHVLIPSNPNVMQGFDSISVDQENTEHSTNQSFSSHQQLSSQFPKIDQITSSSGRENNQAIIGGKPKPCPISQCASKGSVHRHIRYNAFFV
jgi:hypothetical protein